MSDVERVRSGADIVDTVGRYVKLERCGANSVLTELKSFQTTINTKLDDQGGKLDRALRRL